MLYPLLGIPASATHPGLSALSFGHVLPFAFMNPQPTQNCRTPGAVALGLDFLNPAIALGLMGQQTYRLGLVRFPNPEKAVVQVLLCLAFPLFQPVLVFLPRTT